MDIPKAPNIGNSISSAMTTAQAATTSAVSKVNSVFSTNIKENLSVVKATAKDGITALNSYKDTALGGLGSFIKTVTGNALTMKDLTSIIDVRNGFKINQAELATRLSKSVGFPLSSVVGMTNDIQKEVTNLLDAYSKGNVTRMLNAAGVKFKVNDGSSQMVSMLSSVLSRISSTDSQFRQIVDEAAQLAFLNTMLKYTVTAGLWEGIDELLAKYTIPSEGIRALGTFSVIAVKKGDVYTLQAIMDRCGIAAITAVNTNLPTDLLKNFKFTSDTVESEYPDYRLRMLNVLDAANPTWEIAAFNDMDTINLVPFTTASKNALTLLKSQPRFMIQCMIAPSYTKKPLMTLVKDFYPGTAILS